jgi:GTPase SAR1 family protein
MSETNNALNFFLSKYDELKTNLSKSKISDKEILMLFGTSGAGKSTFLSRMLSSKSSEEFVESIIERDTEDQSDVYEEGVKIGAEKKTSTIVPKRFELSGDRVIYDVPGFGDNDANTEQVIQLMYRCLLSKIVATKYVIVIAAPAIYTHERKSTLETEYTSKLVSIFGKENFKKSINDNAIFIITQADMVNETAAEKKSIKEHILDLQDIAAEQEKPEYSLFLTSLRKNHFVVDYSKWDEKKFWDTYSKKNVISPVMAKYNTKNSHLMNQAEKILNNNFNNLSDSIKVQKSVSDSLVSDNENLIINYNNLSNELSRAEESLAASCLKISGYKKFKESALVDIKGWKEDVEKYRELLEGDRAHKNSMKSTIESATYIEQLEFKSVSEGSLSKRDKIVMSMKVDEFSTKRNIIISTCPIVVPFNNVESSRVFVLSDNQMLWNNGEKKTANKLFNCAETRNGSYQNVVAKYNTTFYVTTVTEKKINKQMSLDMLSKVEGRAKEIQEKLEEKEMKIKEFSDTIEANDSDENNLIQSIKRTLKEVESLRSKMDKTIQQQSPLESRFEESHELCAKIHTSISDNEFYTSCIKVSTILNEYGVENTLTTSAENFRTKIEYQLKEIYPPTMMKPVKPRNVERDKEVIDILRDFDLL